MGEFLTQKAYEEATGFCRFKPLETGTERTERFRFRFARFPTLVAVLRTGNSSLPFPAFSG